MKYALFLIYAFLQSSPEVIEQQKNPDLEWQKPGQLYWTDFRAVPERGSFYHAVTATYLEETHGCSDEGKFMYDVKAVFVRNQSWSLEKWSEQLLQHEQVHFDITEVFARHLRQYFTQLKYPCRVPEEEIQRKIAEVYRDLELMHHFYDERTQHGLQSDNQERWETFVKQRLDNLQAYQERK